MRMRIKDTEFESKGFIFSEAHSTLMPFDNKVSGLEVKVTTQGHCSMAASTLKYRWWTLRFKSRLITICLVTPRCVWWTTARTTSTTTRGMHYVVATYGCYGNNSGETVVGEPPHLKPEETRLWSWPDPQAAREMRWRIDYGKEQKCDLIKVSRRHTSGRCSLSSIY